MVASSGFWRCPEHPPLGDVCNIALEIAIAIKAAPDGSMLLWEVYLSRPFPMIELAVGAYCRSSTKVYNSDSMLITLIPS
jgi:hypothetical protein